ncbi:MAG: pyrroline-5-carboxylate reductase [Rhizobiales bacterium]|nr:pyrroline-5-carboxylate reductase [Hyphomicrobiales bacterium]
MLKEVAPLLLVGAGKMGGAMLDRWLARGIDAHQVMIVDPFVEATRRDALRVSGATVVADPAELPRISPRVVVLAVKPQSMSAVLPAIAPLAGSGTAIVSVAAGVRLDKLEAAFPAGQPVVRAMPNTPAQIGMGMTVAVANAGVSGEQRMAVDALLAAVGEVAWVDDEALIDGVTAVSGSGPAYVFLLAECLAEAGRQAGLPADLAERLARQTVAGAGALLADSALPAATLRQNVTSPNGTTAAALAMLMAEDGLQPLLTRAVAAAKRRSVELG